jgi:hypothetical protein
MFWQRKLVYFVLTLLSETTYTNRGSIYTCYCWTTQGRGSTRFEASGCLDTTLETKFYHICRLNFYVYKKKVPHSSLLLASPLGRPAQGAVVTAVTQGHAPLFPHMIQYQLGFRCVKPLIKVRRSASLGIKAPCLKHVSIRKPLEHPGSIRPHLIPPDCCCSW